MSAVLWAAVAFCSLVVLATLAGLALLAFRGWRLFTALRTGLFHALEELGGSVAAVETRLGSFETKSVELQRSVARLQRTLGDARVLLSAAREVTDLVGRVRGVVPTK